MNESPKALRLHIGLFGRRNAGKSSLLNALVGQDVAIVSPTPGSTADPVEKTLEMAPLGPVVFLDTAGLDDRDASLGAQRVERIYQTQLARRPAEWEQAEKLQKGDLTLEPQSRLLTGPAGSCSLSGRECALLELLLRNLGSTLPRERILLNVWGPDSEVESGNIDNYVHLVRRRLGLVGSRMTLVTKRGAGYCLEDTGC